MRNPGYPRGVPSPFATHVHPWPTRYHGPIYTRPVFTFPYETAPQAVFKPDDFNAFYGRPATAGLGASAWEWISNPWGTAAAQAWGPDPAPVVQATPQPITPTPAPAPVVAPAQASTKSWVGPTVTLLLLAAGVYYIAKRNK